MDSVEIPYSDYKNLFANLRLNGVIYFQGVVGCETLNRPCLHNATNGSTSAVRATITGIPNHNCEYEINPQPRVVRLSVLSCADCISQRQPQS
jgi:hypothetical protein